MYQLRTPAPPLDAFLEHYWFVSPDQGPVDLRVDVYVDARADLVLSYGAPWHRQAGGRPATEHRASCLDAQRLHPIRITQRGEVHLVGVRFRLGGLGAFVEGPVRAWTNRTIPLGEAFGPEAAALEASLATADPDEAARRLDTFFLARCLGPTSPTRRASWPAYAGALACLVQHGGRVGVDAVAAAAGVSVRQVERLFAQHLGIPPKVVGRVLRFQEGLRALMTDPGCPLADVALRAGFFDQAHFVREFRRMTGGVPRGYRGYYPPAGPADFAPNVVAFVQAPR